MGTGRSGQMHGDPQLHQDPQRLKTGTTTPPWGQEGQHGCVGTPVAPGPLLSLNTGTRTPPMGTRRLEEMHGELQLHQDPPPPSLNTDTRTPPWGQEGQDEGVGTPGSPQPQHRYHDPPLGTGRSGWVRGDPSCTRTPHHGDRKVSMRAWGPQLHQDPPQPQHRYQDPPPPWGQAGQHGCVGTPSCTRTPAGSKQAARPPSMGTGRSAWVRGDPSCTRTPPQLQHRHHDPLPWGQEGQHGCMGTPAAPGPPQAQHRYQDPPHGDKKVRTGE